MEIPKTNFDLLELKKIATNEKEKELQIFFQKQYELKKKGKKSDEKFKCTYKKTKQYISNNIHPTFNGTHVIFEDGKPEIIQNDTMNSVYLPRFIIIDEETDYADHTLKEWYKRATIPKKLICDVNKPTLTSTCVNLAPEIKHKYKAYNSFSNDTKEKLNIFLDYVKLVWTSNNDEIFTYIMKWLSNMIKGNKNKSCLYAKGPEGVGKSTFTDFIKHHVVGMDLCAKGKSDHLKGNNAQLLGKLFVVFEELQCFSDKEWKAVDSELKDMITDEDGSYSDKYEKRFRAPNINNYIINTNHNAIKGANGRRYMVIPLNTSKQNNHKYFKNIISNCFNDVVGHAFFCYLYEIDTRKFNSLEIPDTLNKNDLCVELMQPHEKFLKDMYVLCERGINNVIVADLYNAYKLYCDNKRFNPLSLIKFCEGLRNLNLPYKKSDKVNKYNYSYERLLEIATSHKWLHELDEDNKNVSKNEYDDSVFDDDVQQEFNKYRKELEELKKENKILSDQIADLNKSMNIKNLSDVKKGIEKRKAERLEELEYVLSLTIKQEPKQKNNLMPAIPISENEITLKFDLDNF